MSTTPVIKLYELPTITGYGELDLLPKYTVEKELSSDNLHQNLKGEILDAETFQIDQQLTDIIVNAFGDRYNGAKSVFEYIRANTQKIHSQLLFAIEQLCFEKNNVLEVILNELRNRGYAAIKFNTQNIKTGVYVPLIGLAPAEESDLGIDILSYDKYIVTFSGGKDSTATFLHLLEMGVDKSKIELWHQEIDGRGRHFFDWEVTTAYCKAFAAHFGVPIYFSWKEGGFWGEMMRTNARTAPIAFEDENHNIVKVGGVRGKVLSRKMFPQLSPDLNVRWCSSYLKIDVNGMAIRNQERFKGIKTVVISGERGEESPNRTQYAEIEPDRADNRGGKSVDRYVDRVRNIKNKEEGWVWDIIKRWKIRVHPAYYMGWGRVSCKWCIYGNEHQFASANYLSPEQGAEIVQLEASFGKTIKRNQPLNEVIAKGTPYSAITEELKQIALSKEYNLPIVMEEWILPAGAFSKDCQKR